MGLSAIDENAKTLGAALGLDEDKAAELLNVAVHIAFNETDAVAAKFANHVEVLLSRTIRRVFKNDVQPEENIQAELVVGEAQPRWGMSTMFIGFSRDRIVIAKRRPKIVPGAVHDIGLLLGACYAVAATLQLALKQALPFPKPEVYDIDLSELFGDDLSLLYEGTSFGEAYLAGAGAIGNASIYALSQFDVDGTLTVADPDTVSEGSLQRCVFFEDDDVTRPKAERLSTATERVLPKVKAISYIGRLQNVPARDPVRGWLKRLIVAVDSPRARRALQAEIPGEVFDASTTGITEVVLHSHKQPTDLACLSCAYHHTPEEDAHDRHVAEALGVSIDEVKEDYVSAKSAKVILKRFPKLKESEVLGAAYDTLYKQLCGQARLLDTSEDRQVLAPFAFVSMLAGTLLAIEFIRRVRVGHRDLFNEWRISPWCPPLLRCQQVVPRKSECAFCGDPILRKITEKMWANEVSRPLPPKGLLPEMPAVIQTDTKPSSTVRS